MRSSMNRNMRSFLLYLFKLVFVTLFAALHLVILRNFLHLEKNGKLSVCENA